MHGSAGGGSANATCTFLGYSNGTYQDFSYATEEVVCDYAAPLLQVSL